MYLIVAKSDCLRCRQWRKRRLRPCSSPPHKVCGFAGAPNLPVAGQTHRAGVVGYIGAVFATQSMKLRLLEDIKMQKATPPIIGRAADNAVDL